MEKRPKYKTKKLYLNLKRTKYTLVHLFKTHEEMQEFYINYSPKQKNHRECIAVSLHKEYIEKKKGSKRWVRSPRTGEILLSQQNLRVGVVTHEIMHATLWAWKHKKDKKQYPIIIRSTEEEKLLDNYSYAVTQFYTWYRKITKLTS